MRTSKDIYKTKDNKVLAVSCNEQPPATAKLFNGYDYKNQSWVKNGMYVECNHPESMQCNCYGKIHKGEKVV